MSSPTAADPAPRAPTFWGRLSERMFRPVDGASINLFRMMFGLVMFWEVWRFFDEDWVRLYYVVRKFYFKYYGFGWVEPWPGDGMYYHFVAMGALALCIMFGLMYRVVSWLYFFGFTYWFLLDQTRYLNHMYLVCLVSFVMALIPAHRARSLDARWRPGIRTQTVPAWCLWILRFQVFIVYFYAGVAKINGDWLRLEPIRSWLSRRDDYPLIGEWLATENAAMFFGYGGLAFDLVVAPLLLWRPTRAWAFAGCVFFHASNKLMFDIGIFPFMALALTTLMFSPSWPRRVYALFGPRDPERDGAPLPAPRGLRRKALVGILGLHVFLQVFLPLRHHLYPGDVNWTEEGHRFAWHMKLRDKKATPTFYATDPQTGRTWEVDHRRWLSSAQSSRVGRWPDMSLQFAHFLADELSEDGRRLEIRVHSRASLNGRERQLLFDPEVDLAAEERNLWHADWIRPLEHDLPAPSRDGEENDDD